MTNVKVSCLLQFVTSGGSRYPLFIGFAPADDILRVADAPCFTAATDHSAIAANLLSPPMKDWQRPISKERVAAISSFFGDVGEIMPNPVLLAENASENKQRVSVRQEVGAHGALLNTWIVEIPEPEDGAQKPLWIIDGQHRISGLAKSRQSLNQVPMVLLINHGSHCYTPNILAKLFAQVTTSAERLQPLHNEWLTYAFGLRSYAPTAPGATEQRHAIEAVGHLCRIQVLRKLGSPNPFFNNVRFNPYASGKVEPRGGGFAFDCIELKDLILDEYYSKTEQGVPLSPLELAEELASAYLALQRVVTGEQRRTVFFGDTETGGHKPMQDGFLAGVLAHLLRHGSPPEWREELVRLQFGRTEWDFSPWVVTMGGAAGTISRKIGFDVMRRIFVDRKLPDGADTLVEYLLGNAIQVKFEASHRTANGRPSHTGRMPITLGPETKNASVDDRRHFRLVDWTPNVGKLVTSEGSSPNNPVFSSQSLQRGLVFDPHSMNSPVKLHVKMELYGGISKDAMLVIKWR